MKSRSDYEAALLVVGPVVRSWDPYSLIGSGAPANEFDAEIAQLVTYIPRITSPAAAAAAVSAVFSAAFEPEIFSSSQCAVFGQELFGCRACSADLISRSRRTATPPLNSNVRPKSKA